MPGPQMPSGQTPGEPEIDFTDEDIALISRQAGEASTLQLRQHNERRALKRQHLAELEAHRAKQGRLPPSTKP